MPEPAANASPSKRVRAPRFQDLRVRPKLIVLHNAFFFILACAIYYALIPLVEDYAATARAREARVLGDMFLDRREPLPFEDLRPEDRRFGAVQDLGIPAAVRSWLDAHPGEVHLDPGPAVVYRKDPVTGEYGRLALGPDLSQAVVTRAKISLFAALGAIYVLAVALLELVIMPRYVYRPIRATLAADEAAREGDRGNELIPAKEIPGDEIGDIMRSRNATLETLREKEDSLERALARLGELAHDLQRKNEQLEGAKRGVAAQDRLATIGLLSASVAHELNTPLSVLRGSIEKLLETVGDPAARARIERMARMTDRLRRISEGLLDFSRAQGPDKREPVDVRALIDEAWTLIALDERASGVKFENRIPAGEEVAGDYDRLMQVFVNLLRNGLYAIEGEGRIVVHSERLALDGGRWVAVKVDDSGSGIPEDVLPNIFEAFVSTRLDSRGTGLGLTVAGGIVQQHGGRITANNRPEGGARLEVHLPAASR